MLKIDKIVQNHHTFFKTGKTKEIDFRLDSLKKIQKVLKKYENEILDALKKDLNKSNFEAYETELGLVYEELKYTIGNIHKWTKKRKVKTPIMHFISNSFIYPEPYGTILIMSPWNYPFQLAMIPLIGAIGAGNCCVLKLSEYSFHTSEIIKKIICEVFQEEYISVIVGGREENQALLNEKFDYIFFTGSPSVGHIVMEAASKNLTPITLELGGKSPCIVDKTADISLSTKRIAWGKFLNAGQTCIAPDYLFVHNSVKSKFIDELKKILQIFMEIHQNIMMIILKLLIRAILNVLKG